MSCHVMSCYLAVYADTVTINGCQMAQIIYTVTGVLLIHGLSCSYSSVPA